MVGPGVNLDVPSVPNNFVNRAVANAVICIPFKNLVESFCTPNKSI